jgi:hypothetical protein
MASLLSVNVGLPRDIERKGCTVHTGRSGIFPASSSLDRPRIGGRSLNRQSKRRWPSASGGSAWPIRRRSASAAPGGPPIFRSYSRPGLLSAERYRISVKIDLDGAAGTWLRDHVRAGDTLDVSSPRGSLILHAREQPVVLLSGGIGVTPVLAMLYDLTAARNTRQVFWAHAARDGAHHPFRAEVRRLTMALPNCRICGPPRFMADMRTALAARP